MDHLQPHFLCVAIGTLGQESGADRLRWIVFDDRGRRLDRSRNLDGAGLTAAWTPPPGSSRLPARLADRRGSPLRVSQRRSGGPARRPARTTGPPTTSTRSTPSWS